MPTINYTQSDSQVLMTGNFCSGGIMEATTLWECYDGGTPGSATWQTSIGGNRTAAQGFKHRLNIANGTNWNAGTWTWRLNITVANMNLTIEQVWLCRINSSNVNQATIGSVTGLSISVGTTGVKSGTISGSAQTISAGDWVAVFILMANSSMSSQLYSYVNDQNFDSPFDTPVAFIAEKPFILNQSIKRASYY